MKEDNSKMQTLDNIKTPNPEKKEKDVKIGGRTPAKRLEHHV